MSQTGHLSSTLRPGEGTDHSVGALSDGHMSFQYNQKETTEPTANKKIPLSQIVAFCLAVLAALGSGLGVGVAINKNKAPPATPSPTTPAPTTSAPTEAPIPPEVQLLDTILPDYTWDRIRQDPQSPQARAYAWFLEELEADQSMLTLPVGRLQQRYALATWYYSTNGDDWYRNDGWLNHSLHECLWFNKPWFKVPPYEGWDARFWANDNMNPCEWPQLNPNVSYANLDTFRHFWQYQNNLGGSIPRQIGLLTGLVSVYLFNNKNLGGTLPTQIGLLQVARVFNCAVNQMTGTLPTQLGAMYSSRGISVFGTNIGGPIPSQLGLLTSLSTLKLDENQLTGTIPTTLGMNPVHELWMSRNQLTGTIPTQLGLLKPLDTRGNDFLLFANLLTGTIPTQLGSFTNRLDLFWLHQNHLTGTLPTQMGRMAGAWDLNLGDNHLTGTLPTQLGLCTTAFRIDLHNNKLKGTIPSQLGISTSLFFIELYDNQLTGTIPPQLPNLAPQNPFWVGGRIYYGLTWFENLRLNSTPHAPVVFAVQNNQLSGTIPPNFARVENLGALQITNNPLLSGSLPEELCNVSAWFLYPEETRAFDCTGLLCGCNCTCSS